MTASKAVAKFPKEKHCCANCSFFDRFDVQKKEYDIIGACHANPPFPIMTDYEGESKLARFPLVLGSFWCGMFDSVYEEERITK